MHDEVTGGGGGRGVVGISSDCRVLHAASHVTESAKSSTFTASQGSWCPISLPGQAEWELKMQVQWLREGRSRVVVACKMSHIAAFSWADIGAPSVINQR